MNNGQIVHIELKSADYDRSSQFYSRLFGWKMQNVPEMNYMTFQADGGPGGGFVKPEMSQAPGCLAYLQVENVESKLGEIQQAGGRTILGPMPVGEMGVMAIFADPDGNTIGLWKTNLPPKVRAASGGAKAARRPAKPAKKSKVAKSKKSSKKRR